MTLLGSAALFWVLWSLSMIASLVFAAWVPSLVNRMVDRRMRKLDEEDN